MLRWLVALVVGTAVGRACSVARADELRAAPFGFDHTFHDRDLIVKNVGSLPCARCHAEQKGKLLGKPGHEACFGACHGEAPKPPKKGAKVVFGERTKVCQACHAEAVQAVPFTGKLAVSYPPYAIDPDFNIAYGHKQHATVACSQCHDVRDVRAGQRRSRAVHDRCAGCHDGSGAAGHGPAMSACAGCHPAAIGNPEPPQLAALHDTVSATFSHSKHAARGGGGKDCLQCHADIRDTDDTQLPRPTTQSCGVDGCHDGKAAFATTTSCTRCHDKPPERFEVWRPTARFLHIGFHAEVVGKRGCAGCHTLGSRGDPQVAGHAACVECHAADFSARKPMICGACHSATEPWRQLAPDRAPAEQTEFGAMLDHDKHGKDCARCHQLRTQTQELRPPRGHTACTGDGCHAAKGGPEPQLAACDGCHRAGLQTAREAARLHAPWSVRATFEHATHASADCTTCHTSLAGADLVALATPPKSTCASCHDDGKTAFKLTGTTCSRCHRGNK